MRRMSTNAVARSWRVALADGIAASRKAAASNNSGEVILRKTVPGLGQLHLGASQPLSKQVPGNGGLRLWQYDSPEKASSEAARLGKGVAVKDEKSGQGTTLPRGRVCSRKRARRRTSASTHFSEHTLPRTHARRALGLAALRRAPD